MFVTVIALKYAFLVSQWFLKLADSVLFELRDKSSPFNSTHYIVLYPQNGDRIVTIDSVTSLHPIGLYCSKLSVVIINFHGLSSAAASLGLRIMTTCPINNATTPAGIPTQLTHEYCIAARPTDVFVDETVTQHRLEDEDLSPVTNWTSLSCCTHLYGLACRCAHIITGCGGIFFIYTFNCP